MRRFIVSVSMFLLVVFGAFTATAFAASAAASVEPDPALIDLARPVLDAVMHGQGWLAATFALVLLVGLAKRFGGDRFPWLRSDAGGASLVLVGGFGGAVATALAAGGAMGGALALTALKVSMAAAGGFALIKKLLMPALRKVAARCPAWTQPIFALVFWIFDQPTPVAKAEAAGVAAVKAKPAAGIAGVTGAPHDVP